MLRYSSYIVAVQQHHLCYPLISESTYRNRERRSVRTSRTITLQLFMSCSSFLSFLLNCLNNYFSLVLLLLLSPEPSEGTLKKSIIITKRAVKQHCPSFSHCYFISSLISSVLFYTFSLSFTSCHSALNNNKAPVCGTIDLQSVRTLHTPSPSESYISPHACFIFNIAPLTSSLLMPLPRIFMAQSTPPFSNRCLPESAPISPAHLSLLHDILTVHII